MPARARNPDPQDIAAEIVRRIREANAKTGGGYYVVRLRIPPTVGERLQVLAARLEGRKVAIMPHKCETMEEWTALFGRQ